MDIHDTLSSPYNVEGEEIALPDMPITPVKIPKAVVAAPEEISHRPKVPRKKDGSVMYSEYIQNTLLMYYRLIKLR